MKFHRRFARLIAACVSAVLLTVMLQFPIRPAQAFIGAVSPANSIIGSSSNDRIGSGGVIELPNGNVLIISQFWNWNRGAVTCLTPAQYKSGNIVVSAANSLVGSSAGDFVGELGVTILKTGNYVVNSPRWMNGGVYSSGAATFGKSDCTTIGPVSVTNSLVGTNANDKIGNQVIALTNGNYVVSSPYWSNSLGASTWGSGTVGIIGGVSATNSLFGSVSGDHVGGDITALNNGNYVVSSPDWNGTVGAVTWENGTTGTVGQVSPANSLVGTAAADGVGSCTNLVPGVIALTNGNYVVNSCHWSNQTGAVTWGNGAVGVQGTVSVANSLVGEMKSDSVGSSGVIVLTNGNYVVGSPVWNGGRGAATWGNGSTGVSGVISINNSLVGATVFEGVGTILMTLTNGNYVVGSPVWNGGRGAATWGNGVVGTTGFISASNSLVGGSADDNVGTNITALSNGHYVVSSNWQTLGAVTWGNGATGITGFVSTSNSLVGSTANYSIGAFVTALSNGNYVASSPSWNGGRGAATWGNGTTGTVGQVSSANSLVGSNVGDRVGDSGVFPLVNGNYIVSSSVWNGGRGAATWGNGTTGVTGVISASNSLVGSAVNDQVGYRMTALSNGNYVVGSPGWNGNRGAATWGNGTTGATGIISASNSLVGSSAGDQVGWGGVTALSDGSYLVLSPNWGHGSIAQVGAVTYGTAQPQTHSLDTIGTYVNGVFYLRNSNSAGLPDLTVPFNPYGVAMSKLLPITGDWNGDGIDTVGLYDTSVGVFVLSDSNTNPSAQYALVMGNPQDEPIAGHWDATMTGDGVGVYRPSNGLLYVKRTLATGYADYTMVLGNPGDHGIAGDWDGNGYDSVGVYRPVNTMFYLANALGGTTQTPAIIFSDYNFVFGPATLTPIAGDWTGSGTSHVGYVMNGTFYLKYTHSAGAADNTFAFSSAGAKPVTGHWVAPGQPAPSNVLVEPPTGQPSAAPPLKPGGTPNGGGLFD